MLAKSLQKLAGVIAFRQICVHLVNFFMRNHLKIKR